MYFKYFCQFFLYNLDYSDTTLKLALVIRQIQLQQPHRETTGYHFAREKEEKRS